MILYRLPNKNKTYLVISLLLWFCFISFACLCVFGAVVTVVSTALHSLALVCLNLLHGTLFPWGKIKEIKVDKKFWHYFLLWNFACWFDFCLICLMLASCGCGVAKVVCLYSL